MQKNIIHKMYEDWIDIACVLQTFEEFTETQLSQFIMDKANNKEN